MTIPVSTPRSGRELTVEEEGVHHPTKDCFQKEKLDDGIEPPDVLIVQKQTFPSGFLPCLLMVRKSRLATILHVEPGITLIPRFQSPPLPSLKLCSQHPPTPASPRRAVLEQILRGIGSPSSMNLPMVPSLKRKNWMTRLAIPAKRLTEHAGRSLTFLTRG